MAESPSVLCIDDVCRPLQFPNGYSPGKISITKSVGINGTNLPPDVKTIQQALNDVPAGHGRPNVPLKVDGICGPRTKDSIQGFQVKHFGWKLADGRVDPYYKTIAKLNEVTPGAGRTVGTGSDQNRIQRVTAMLDVTLSTVRAARANLLATLPVIDMPDTASPISAFSRSALVKKVNDHFRVDSHAAPERKGVIHQLLRIFDRMLEVFARRGGPWGPAIFEIDPIAQPNLAYTFGGGYFSGGRIENYHGTQLRRDSIYLCSLLDLQGDDWFVMSVVHELSHFCGGITGSPDHIRDHAYGWHDAPKMKALTRKQVLFNATSYSNFAFDAKFSRRPARVNF